MGKGDRSLVISAATCWQGSGFEWVEGAALKEDNVFVLLPLRFAGRPGPGQLKQTCPSQVEPIQTDVNRGSGTEIKLAKLHRPRHGKSSQGLKPAVIRGYRP